MVALPILAAMARRALAASACSADVERFFSHAGDVCTPDRNSLLGLTVNVLTTLNFVFRRMIGYEDKRNVKSAGRVRRFTELNVNLELETPTDMSALIDEEYNHDENADGSDNDD